MGNKLKYYRIRQGLTVQELSRKARVSVGHISYIENGLKDPTLKVMCKLARALGVELGDLYDCK